MELNHRLLHVGQVSLPLDHGIVLSVTEVGIEPAIWSYRGPSLHPPYRSAAGPCWHLDLAAVPVCVLGRLFQFEKWRVRESHPAVKAYEAPMGTGPPAMREIGSQCVGTELNRQSPKAGGLRPLGLANAQPTRLKLVTRVGVETTDHEGLSFAALSDCVSRRFVKKRPRGDLNP
jgi:hypothetical protein